MLRLPPIEFRQVRSLREAARVLEAEGPSARAVAGGTDLWPNLKRRHQSARTVVSLMRVANAHGVRLGRRYLRIGPTTRLADLAADRRVRAHYPALASAVGSIASPPLRQMGTIGGNLCLDTRCNYYDQSEEWRRSVDYCLKEAGTVCWVATRTVRCFAYSATDAAPMLCALGARVRLTGPAGGREVALSELYADDGIEYLAKRHDELIAEILVPREAAEPGCRATYWKLRRRAAIDFPVLSVAAALWTDPAGIVTRASLVLGAVASRPLEATEASRFLEGERPDPERIAEAARLARRAATPMDNCDFSPAWRGRMVENYVRGALNQLAGIPQAGSPPRSAMAL